MSIVEELVSLKNQWYEAEFEFFDAAHEIEKTRADEWRRDYITFDALLQDGVKTSAKRYRAFVEACKKIGKERVRSFGIDAAVAAARHTNPAERAKMIAHFEASRKENGKPLSPSQVRTVRDRLSAEERESGYEQKTARRQTREAELYAENVALKKENKRLKTENTQLRERLALIEGSAKPKRGDTRKPGGKHA